MTLNNNKNNDVLSFITSYKNILPNLIVLSLIPRNTLSLTITYRSLYIYYIYIIAYLVINYRL